MSNKELINVDALIRQQANAACGIGANVDVATMVAALRQQQEQIASLTKDLDNRFAESDHLSAKYWEKMRAAQAALEAAKGTKQ